MKKIIFINIILIINSFLFGQNINISNGNVFDGEPYIAINPNNSSHLVVAWMGWVNLSNQFKIKTKASFDGGITWSNTYEFPHTISNYSSADPSLAFNNAGEVFVCYIDFTGTTPPVTGGVYINKSTDGGLSWGGITEVINTNYDGTKWPIDRPWMVIDKSSSPNQDNIYVTTMNLNRANSPYNPYLSVSTDNGNTFTTRYLDTAGWLAGSLNPLPMCSPTVTSSGVFCGIYPSYVPSQNVFVQNILARSNSSGNSVSHNTAHIVTSSSTANDNDAKKGALLISNQADSNHLAYVFLRTVHGDLDVYLKESFNQGVTWTTSIRINDDPIGNDRMQDLLWADFDLDGDLIISWRDRRNGNDSTYQTETEIWAAYRDKDSSNFEPNFPITNQIVAYDSVLESAGNDFMCIKIQNDTLNAVWGDTRNGKLNIWFQRMKTNGNIVSIKKISSENIPHVLIYPNPTTSKINIKAIDLKSVCVYDVNGKKISSLNNLSQNNIIINIENYPKGTYIVEIKTINKTVQKKIFKQ